MKKLIIALLMFLCGCRDEIHDWEAKFILREYSPDDLMSTESLLYSNGYKRVKFYYSNYMGAYMFYATHKEDKQ